MISTKFLNKIKFQIKVILRILDVLMIYISYIIIPKYTYLFSTRKLYPAKKNRWIKNKFEPYLILNKSKKKFKKINLIAKGSSFNLNDIKKFKDPTFLVGFTNTLKIKNGNIIYQHGKEDFRYKGRSRNLKLFQKQNIYYVNYNPFLAEFHKNDKVLFIEVIRKKTDSKEYFWPGLKKFKKKLQVMNKFKTIQKVKMVENIYKNYDIEEKFFAPSGSTVPTIYYLLSVSKRVNVYGWDFYFDNKIKEYNFFSFRKNIYKLEPDTRRSWNHIESCLMNLYFANILEKRKEISLKGNLSELNCQKKFINKFEKVIFK